ncbi:MAG: NAD-dependent epimerase/dehydratase family protein [Pirellulales bacterium]
MRVLVTGAGGFLGSHVCRQLLASGHTVRGLGRNHYPLLDNLGIEQQRVDIRDSKGVADAVSGMDAVVHTAAIAGIWGPRRQYESINVTGTANVLAACQQHGVRRLVYTSSPSVTFSADDQCGVDETTPYAQRWLCEYPRTKAVAEQMVLQANSARLATCALRPHLIWGPGDPHLLARLWARARSGRLRRVGTGDNLIDIIYVDNAAAAHVAAVERLEPGSPLAGTPVFISQGEPVNCWDWIGQLLGLQQLELPQRGLTFRQAWNLGWGLECVYRLTGQRREPPMTRFLAAQLAKSHYFSIDRARRLLDFDPSVSTADGMGRLAKWLSSG